MTGPFHVDVYITFHREGLLAVPAIKSAFETAESLRKQASVSLHALVDSPDCETREIISFYSTNFTSSTELQFKDLGLVRNHASLTSKGDFIAMLDGDDLWGRSWLLKAFEASKVEIGVYHPEFLIYFSESKIMSRSESGSGYILVQDVIEKTDLTNQSIGLVNPWSANNFMPTDLAKIYLYPPADHARGLGVEDWSWNWATFVAGIPHLVARDTVHFIRVKDFGSLGVQNVRRGLSPYLPSELSVPEWGFGNT